ncbi:hypothetical protein DK847_13600 [Aestuariivirga litoralis]|uniref:DUF4013 domain-containing protein n=2 Tax=Aestuariivirga litoralis TaxID=2650924 RepID=A0A2W2ARH0_9HYPH|nr:hypothetical protein DK847_13600 [Aestuariivirga litoralis]
MEATEFAIDKAFRHFFFALGLLVGWAILLLPLFALVWYVAFGEAMPDFKALPPAAIGGLVALGLGVLLASFSIETNWNRRILLDERPSLLGRWRLDGPVWRYAAGVVLMLAVLALYAAAGAAVMVFAVPKLTAQLGAAAQPLGIVVTALIGLSGLFTFYRLMSWLAGLSVGDRDYGLGAAWRTTKGNRLAFLAFTFWIVFSLAMLGALGAGAFFAQQALPQPWVKPSAFGIIGLLTWLALLVVHSVPAALYRSFR